MRRERGRDTRPAAATPGALFTGSELPRLVLLLAIVVIGWPIVILRLMPQAHKPPPTKPVTASSLTKLPPADPSPAFQGLQDRTPLTARDNAAYADLLSRARSIGPEKLRASARRDVVFSQILEDPKRFRGLPIHLEGTILRVLSHEVEGSVVTPRDRLFEAWVVTPDSQSYPWVLSFEDAPPDLPMGDAAAGTPFTFDGYFLKLMAYLAGDRKGHVAPLIVGRFPPAPAGRSAVAAPPRPAGRGPWWTDRNKWVLGGLGLISIYAALRVVLVLRRSLSRPSISTQVRSRRLEQIEPDALAEWVEGRPKPRPEDDDPYEDDYGKEWRGDDLDDDLPDDDDDD